MVRVVLSALFMVFWSMEIKAADTRQMIFHSDFATLQVELDGHPERLPIMSGEPGERLVVKFDELSDNRRNLRFSLQHCTADWQPSDLLPSEFASGWNEGRVPDGEFSHATLVHYVHYELRLPDDGVSPLLPGNYLLRVFDEDTPEETLLQARFGVSSEEIAVSGKADFRTDIDYLASHQQLELEAEISRAEVTNPYTDIRIVVDRNSQPETERVVNQPSMVSGQKIFYRHLPQLIFDAGNEYRRMEILATQWPGMGVSSIANDGEIYYAIVGPDEPRNESGYVYDETQHGRMTIREYNSSRSDIEADYLLTTFVLTMPKLEGYDIYLEGDLTERRLDDSSLMSYELSEGAYVYEKLFKQGAYNYQYVARKRSDGTVSTALTEGNYYPTRNHYNVRVYYRRAGERYDRLAGFTTIEL